MERFDSKDGSHTAILGDALNVLEDEIEDSSVDLVFADPPYNIGKSFAGNPDRWPSDEAYVDWCKSWLSLCIRKLKPDGSLYVMTSTQAMPYVDIWLRDKIHILSRIVWHYDSSGVQARKYFGSMYEPVLYGVKDPKNYVFNAEDIEVEARTGATRKLIDYRKPDPKPYNTKKVPGNVWSLPRVRYRMSEYEEHPTQKPEALLERIIRASSNPDSLVLDPFAGSFTTGAVAQRLDRKSVSVELSEEYLKIGLRRLAIVDEYRGEKLAPPEKSYRRVNGQKNSRTRESADSANLF